MMQLVRLSFVFIVAILFCSYESKAQEAIKTAVVDETPKDPIEDWRLKAESGDAIAQICLGGCYNLGQGVPKDEVEAVKWYRKAAIQGNVDAQASIGLMIGLGQGVPQDFLTAHMWLNIAAANGMEEMVAIRDLVATKMTPAQLTEAQSRASVCMASNYQDCG